MFSRLILIAGCAGAMISAPASAQPANDVRCLILSNAFAKQANNEQARALAQSSLSFYLGKIDGRMNDAHLRATMQAQQKTITVAKAGPQMNECVKGMQASVRRMQSIAPNK